MFYVLVDIKYVKVYYIYNYSIFFSHVPSPTQEKCLWSNWTQRSWKTGETWLLHSELCLVGPMFASKQQITWLHWQTTSFPLELYTLSHGTRRTALYRLSCKLGKSHTRWFLQLWFRVCLWELYGGDTDRPLTTFTGLTRQWKREVHKTVDLNICWRFVLSHHSEVEPCSAN